MDSLFPDFDGRDPRLDCHVATDDIERRAERFASTSPRPFLRWAGSKQSLLRHIAPKLPTRFRTYYEPFLGSGALFFLLRPQRAVLGDHCIDLVETFTAVRDNVSAVIRYLKPLHPDKRVYYEIRSRRSRGKYKRAAEFIYLNKTCWNGLYRVNSQGVFNVPFGRPKSDGIFDADNVSACADTLRGNDVTIRSSDFEDLLNLADNEDLVYLDPPYVTRHNNNGFREWNETLFSWEDQIRLSKIATKLARKGAKVIVTNANHKEILDLYPGFKSETITRTSTLASDSSKRGLVTEAILFSVS